MVLLEIEKRPWMYQKEREKNPGEKEKPIWFRRDPAYYVQPKKWMGTVSPI
jgi:hypothetical protein